MTTDKTINKAIKIATFKGKGYTVNVASNWKAKQTKKNQTAFLGPKVGNLNLGFYITVLPKKNKNYLDAASISKATQSKETDYNIIEETDISQENFKALTRRASWYNEEKDMVLFAREIFTETESEVFILSATIPNTPNLAELDNVIVAMMNSFRFTQ